MMLKQNYLLVTFLILAIQNYAFSQFQYHFNQDIQVSQGATKIEMPWVGGLNLAQYNALDINNDGILDLFLFDRHSSKPICFISDGSSYTYAPEYEHYFPADLDHWVLLRDYNCDGKKDLFTSSLFGMRLFENTSEPNGPPSWELVYGTIFTEGASGQVNLQVNKGDIPGIEDIDGDGDLDILVFNFALGGGIELHKNMSVERTGNCDLDLMETTDKYGGFMECTCIDYVFGDVDCPISGRLEHSGGKTIVSYSYTTSSAQDILVGQEDCTSYAYLPNTGTMADPIMSSVDFNFPNSTNPITLNFPSAFNLDLDFDGIEDLLVTNNIFSAFSNPEYAANNWFYKGSEQGYQQITKGYLQQDMIDIGHGAAPAFFDLDGDGDEDLLIGSESLEEAAAIQLYRNTGDALNPELELESEDYLNLSALQGAKLAPQLIDVNEDNRKDLVISYGSQRSVRVYNNTGNALQPFSGSDFLELDIPIIGQGDNLHFYRTAGKLGLLVGRETGRLSQYINQGSINNPIWEMQSDSFLGIIDDFRARNIAVFIDDMDADGKQDMLRYDDSGVLKVYNDFRGGANVFEELMQDTATLLGYNSSFGRNGLPVVTRITGAELPSIVLGMVGGGLQLLTNIEDKQQSIDIPVRIATFPNPIARNQLLEVVVNKESELRIINAQGQVFLENLRAVKNQRISFDLRSFRAGLYLVEATDPSGNRAVSRIVITE